MSEPLRLLDLFSGIGGFSLGLERSGGFKTVAFCEIDPYCRRVLAKHWPETPCYDDVRSLTADRLRADGIGVDAICGGFPCQDVSLAGARGGLDAERSGLWSEYARLVRELRPRFVIVENTPGLLSLGMGTVLGDLAALGYDAEWHCIPASAVGAPHRRDRVWIVAYPDLAQRRQVGCSRHGLAQQQDCVQQREEGSSRPSTGGEDVALPVRDRLQGALWSELCCVQEWEYQSAVGSNQWAVEPDVGRMAHGVSARSHRLKGLGNAVVPQIPEIIGRAILQSIARAA